MERRRHATPIGFVSLDSVAPNETGRGFNAVPERPQS